MTRYTKDHEWVTVEGDVATVGISAYAADRLGDVVYVELPEVGRAFKAGDEAAVVESVKAASEVYAPVAGEVLEVNRALETAPETVNQAPEAGGWFFKLKMRDRYEAGRLMDELAYKELVETLI